MRGIVCAALASGLGSLSMQALAAPASDRLAPDLYVDLQLALTSNMSKLVSNNDRGTVLSYGAGTFAGSDNNLEFLMLRQNEATSYALNQSDIKAAWQDTSIRYHIGYFYLAGIFSQLESQVTSQGTPIIDAAGSGMGGGLGMQMGIGRGGSLHLDLGFVSISSMKNALDGEVSVPQRLDMDLGGSIDLTQKLLDLTFGYRVRMTTYKTDSSYSDSSYQTYVGLRCSFYL